MRKKSCNILSFVYVELNFCYKCIIWVLDGLFYFEWCVEFVDVFKGIWNKYWFVYYYCWDFLEYLCLGEVMVEFKVDGDEDYEELEVFMEEEKMVNICVVCFIVILKYVEIL